MSFFSKKVPEKKQPAPNPIRKIVIVQPKLVIINEQNRFRTGIETSIVSIKQISPCMEKNYHQIIDKSGDFFLNESKLKISVTTQMWNAIANTRKERDREITRICEFGVCFNEKGILQTYFNWPEWDTDQQWRIDVINKSFDAIYPNLEEHVLSEFDYILDLTKECIQAYIRGADSWINENVPLDMPHFTMEWIKQEEIKSPTHWHFKMVKDPVEMNYRAKALRKSMQKDYNECIEVCIEGLKKYPESPYLWYLLGRTYSDVGNFVESFKVLDHTIAQFPNFSDAFIERGVTNLKTGNIGYACEDFTNANKIEPGIKIPSFSTKCYLCNAPLNENSKYFVVYPRKEKEKPEIATPEVICDKCASKRLSNV